MKKQSVRWQSVLALLVSVVVPLVLLMTSVRLLMSAAFLPD